MVCRATTIASIYGDGLLKDGNASLDDAILSFTDIINRESNPADAYDRNKLFGLTLALNNVLGKIDLSNYDSLKNKYQQAPFTMEDFADFINQSSYSFDDVNYIITDFNNAVIGINTNNTSTVSPNNDFGIGSAGVVAGPVSGYTLGDVELDWQGELSENRVTGRFDGGGSFTGTVTGDTSGPFTGVDVNGIAVDGTFFIGVRTPTVGPINTPFIAPSNSITSGILDFLNALDFFLTQNVASSITAGICNAFSNMFGKLKEIIEAINVGIGLLESFLADPLGAFLSAIEGVIGGLAAVAAAAKAIVDKLVSTLTNQIKNIVNQVTSFIQNLPQNTADMFKKIAEKVRNIQNFFSDVTIDKIKEKIEGFVDQSSAQFEELTKEAIEFLQYRFCKFGEMLQSFFQRPLNLVKDFTLRIQNEQALMQSVGLEQTQLATQAGATRFTDTAIRSAQQRLRSRANRRAEARTSRSSGGGGGGGGGGTSPGAPPPPDPTVYVSNNELTEAERSALMNLGPEGTSAFEFSPSVLNMGKSVSDAGDNDGFARVDPNVWAKITIVARRMGKRFTINSGYRSPQYNARIGGARRSMHMSAKAIDVSTRGWTTEEKADFIRKCSQEGFLGIGTYGTFIHVDIGSRRKWTSGENRFNEYLAMHTRDEFRNGAA